MASAHVNGIFIHYKVTGSGENIVFINGMSANRTSWVYQEEIFARKYQVLTYDCRGQGLSEKPEEPVYLPSDGADDLAALLDELGIKKTHIVGLSYGGAIAQHFAIKYPMKLSALVLVDTFSYVEPLLKAVCEGWILAIEEGSSVLRFDVALPWVFGEEFIKEKPEIVQNIRKMSIENPSEPLISLIKGSLAQNTTKDLHRIKAPTLVIAGENDILVPKKYSKILCDNIPNARLAVIEGCGHVPPIEKPMGFNEIVLGFLGGIEVGNA